MFLPIMRATLRTPAVRDPEVLERLDSTPLCNLCHLYQNLLNTCATEVSSEQEKLTKQIALVSNTAFQKQLYSLSKISIFLKNFPKFFHFFRFFLKLFQKFSIV